MNQPPAATTPALERLRINGPAASVEVCIGLLSDYCRGIVEVSSADDESEIEFYLASENHQAVTGIIAGTRSASQPSAGKLDYAWEQIADAEYDIQWRGNFPPLLIGGRLAIVPEWDAESSTGMTLIMRPATAFGTGHHATSQMVLEYLLENDLHGRSILDLGTGSGILAIAAILMGAKRVDAIEYDASCRENFAANVALNGVTEKIAWIAADATVWADFSYDLIMANIQRSIIFPALRNWVQSPANAPFLVSGIQVSESRLLTEICSDLNIRVAHRKKSGDWLFACLEKIT